MTIEKQQQQNKKQNDSSSPSTTANIITPPKAYTCQLTHRLMVDPMINRYGIHFEADAILDWLDSGRMYCPVTRKPLRVSNLISDKTLKFKIEGWKKQTGYCCSAQSADHVESDEHKDEDDSIVSMLSESGNSERPAESLLGKTIVTNSRCGDRHGGRTEESSSKRLSAIMTTGQIVLTPQRFRCALTNQVMEDPVMTKTGINCERRPLLRHLQSNGMVCPVTKQRLLPSGVISNAKLKWEIGQWQLYHGNGRSHASYHESTARSTMQTGTGSFKGSGNMMHGTTASSCSASSSQRLSELMMAATSATAGVQGRISVPSSLDFIDNRTVDLPDILDEVWNIVMS